MCIEHLVGAIKSTSCWPKEKVEEEWVYTVCMYILYIPTPSVQTKKKASKEMHPSRGSNPQPSPVPSTEARTKV